jgi:hypothetical protein
LRRWLLALVCLLLIADGYWASRNLVLKSADDEVYYFRFPINGGQVSAKNSAGDANDQFDRLYWTDERWMLDGMPVGDVKSFIRYWNDYDTSSCSLLYRLDVNASIKAAISSMNAAFAAGAEDATIMSPSIDWAKDDGAFQTALFFQTTKYDANTCPNEEARRKAKSIPGYGYPNYPQID